MSSMNRGRFGERTVLWDGLGINVKGERSVEDVLYKAGTDWQVGQSPVFTGDGTPVKGYKANIRGDNGDILGLVSDKYKVVQNEEAFIFTEELLKYGFRYQFAGSYQGGKKTWVLMKTGDSYIVNGERICNYVVFITSHDGSSSLKIAITPVRMLCCNMLNLALRKARRIWSFKHSLNIGTRLQDAYETVQRSEEYMDQLGLEISRLCNIPLSTGDVERFVDQLLPMPEEATSIQTANVIKQRKDFLARYHEAPDLQHVGHNAYRFINAASDFATHSKPIRETSQFRENLFMRSIEGNPLIDKALELVA